MTERIRHYYEVTGKGEWLVLIHGWAGSTRMWQKEVSYLSERFKVLYYDLRGHAQTGPTALEKYSLKLVADDLARLMDELGIREAHICSLSLGTIVAQGFQIYYPERVKSHVLIGPPGRFTGHVVSLQNPGECKRHILEFYGSLETCDNPLNEINEAM